METSLKYAYFMLGHFGEESKLPSEMERLKSRGIFPFLFLYGFLMANIEVQKKEKYPQSVRINKYKTQRIFCDICDHWEKERITDLIEKDTFFEIFFSLWNHNSREEKYPNPPYKHTRMDCIRISWRGISDNPPLHNK
jgi:hypothetical protein